MANHCILCNEKLPALSGGHSFSNERGVYIGEVCYECNAYFTSFVQAEKLSAMEAAKEKLSHHNPK